MDAIEAAAKSKISQIVAVEYHKNMTGKEPEGFTVDLIDGVLRWVGIIPVKSGDAEGGALPHLHELSRNSPEVPWLGRLRFYDLNSQLGGPLSE